MEHGGFPELQAKWDESGRGRPEAMMKSVHMESTPATFGRSGIDFAELTTEALPPFDFPVILELGCGPGRVTRWLAPSYKKVYAVDIAPVFREFLERLQAAGELAPNVVPMTGNGTDLIIDEPLDGIYTSLVLMHNTREDVEAIFHAFYDLLRPGGRVAFQLPVYDFKVVGGNWRQVSQWTLEEVDALAEVSGFYATRVMGNKGRYVFKDPKNPPGPNHFALHIFTKSV